jgi:hypothetical protein
MIDYRFTGWIKDQRIDVRFRTDAILPTDDAFNILQIQVGSQFIAGENNSPSNPNLADPNGIYAKYFSGYEDPISVEKQSPDGVGFVFKRKNSRRGAMITFAMNMDLNLEAIDEKGNVTEIVYEVSFSSSASLALHTNRTWPESV